MDYFWGRKEASVFCVIRRGRRERDEKERGQLIVVRGLE
jgi:hypothetical protein